MQNAKKKTQNNNNQKIVKVTHLLTRHGQLQSG